VIDEWLVDVQERPFGVAMATSALAESTRNSETTVFPMPSV
jgi:hypothetical protein